MIDITEYSNFQATKTYKVLIEYHFIISVAKLLNA